MNVANEMNIGRKKGEDAPAAVSAIAGEHDLVAGKPLRCQLDQFAGQFRSSTMVGIYFRSFASAFFPFCETLSIAIEPHGNRQGEDFGGRPERLSDDQAKHNPVM